MIHFPPWRFKSISSSQTPQFVASYVHGKQGRTKARKEKTEETKSVAAKTGSNRQRASSPRPPTKGGLSVVFLVPIFREDFKHRGILRLQNMRQTLNLFRTSLFF